MPMPAPYAGETRSRFVSRFMGSALMQKEYGGEGWQEVLMAEPKNDNDTEKVALLKERIQAHTPLQVILTAQQFLGATIAPGGQTWKKGTTKSGAQKRPQRDKPDVLRIPLDIISDKIDQLYGRLSVNDFQGNFVTLEDERVGTESAEYAQKLDLLQDLLWRWLPRSRIQELADDLNFRRVVFGWETARWRLPWTPKLVKKYGALILDRRLGTRLVTDPHVTNQDPNDHRYMISIEAMPIAEINALYKDGLTAKNRYPIETGRKMGDLVASDQHLTKFIGRKVYGAYSSKTPGLIVCSMWDNWWETLDIFVLNLEHTDLKTRIRKKRDWLKVWPVGDQTNDWPYGCPWLKLDCYRNVRKWVGDSLNMKLAGPQAMTNLMLRSKMRKALYQALVRVLVMTNALEQGGADKIKSNRQFEVIGIKHGGFPTDKIAQVLQFPRIDPAESELLALAVTAAERTSGSAEALMGKPSPREPVSGYVSRVEQALVPLLPTAASDQRRTTEWEKNGMEAAARFHGTSSPRKQCIVIFGPNHKALLSGSGSVARVRAVLDSGDVKFLMHDEAFRPAPVAELKEQMLIALEAGRFGDMSQPENWRHFAIQWFLRTGEEYEKGESDMFQEANRVVGMALRGERVEVAYGDPVVWIIYLAKRYLGVSRGRRYTPKQRLSLRRLKAAARDVQDVEVAEEAAITMRRQAAVAGRMAGGPGGSAAGAAAGAGSEAGGARAPEALMAEAG